MVEPGTTGVVPGSGWPATWLPVRGPLQRTGEGETSLLRCLLRLAAQAASASHVVATPRVLRLSQALGHVGPRQFN
jgi:hypothetical protein